MVRAKQGSLTQNKSPIIPLGGGLALKKQTHNADSFSNLVSEVLKLTAVEKSWWWRWWTTSIEE